MRGLLLYVVVVLFVSGSVAAQIGETCHTVERRWGLPVAGNLDEGQSGKVTYARKAMRADVLYENGYAVQMSVTKKKMTQQDVERLLEENVGVSVWDCWVPPGMKVENESGSGSWIRQDELAFASLGVDCLMIKGVVLLLDAPPKVRPLVEEEKKPARRLVAVETANVEKHLKPRYRRKELPVMADPDPLPKKGDGLAAMVERVGEPQGEVFVGNKTMLIYSWGKVWGSEGKILSFER